MLTQQGGMLNIHPQAKYECSGHANSARLVDTPKENADCQNIWQPKGLRHAQQHAEKQGH
jgi:hypothetical protein